MKKNYLYLICLFMAFFLVSCQQGFSKEDRETIEAKADKVILALAEYHKKNNCYPDKLGDLIPDYLTVLPTPRESKFPVAFNYEQIRINNQPEFQLFFFSATNTFFMTRSRTVIIYRPSGEFLGNGSRGHNQRIVTKSVNGNWAIQIWSRKK